MRVVGDSHTLYTCGSYDVALMLLHFDFQKYRLMLRLAWSEPHLRPRLIARLASCLSQMSSMQFPP